MFLDLQYFAEPEEVKELGTEDTSASAAETDVDIDTASEEELDAIINKGNGKTEPESEPASKVDQPKKESATETKPTDDWKTRYENAQKAISKQGNELHEAREAMLKLQNEIAEMQKTLKPNYSDEQRVDFASDAAKLEAEIERRAAEKARLQALNEKFDGFKKTQVSNQMKEILQKDLDVQSIEEVMPEIVKNIEEATKRGIYPPESFAKFKADPFNPVYHADIKFHWLDMKTKKLAEENQRLKEAAGQQSSNMVDKLNKISATGKSRVATGSSGSERNFENWNESDIDNASDADLDAFLKARGAIK